MKLLFSERDKASAGAAPVVASIELEELRALFQRLSINPLSDSDSVRIAILGRMLLVQGEILNKYLSSRY